MMDRIRADHFNRFFLAIGLFYQLLPGAYICLHPPPPLEKGGKGGFKCLENPPISPFAKGGSFILNLKIVIEKCKQYNAPLNNKMAKSEDRG